MLCFSATPVGIIILEIQGITALLREITPTENIRILVPEMNMDQCREDTGMHVFIKGLKLTESQLVIK